MPMSGGGLFWGEKAVSEPKLLPVIHGLLTTTGCGPRRGDHNPWESLNSPSMRLWSGMR